MSVPRAKPATGLDWARDGRDWPHREASRFVEAGGLRWHVQVMGQGPTLLLVHGTGASSHSWRDLVPLLADRFTLVIPDLPGHGFSGTLPPRGMTLPGIAAALQALLETLALAPQIAVGHSAGAAIAVEMCLDALIAPAGLISVNGALLPIGGLAGQVFAPLAKVLASGTTLPRLFARWAGEEGMVDRLIAQTGSTLPPGGLAFYRRLAADPRHAAGALAMMAHWDLATLARRLPDLTTPLLLVVGSRDRSISPNDAFRVRSLVPGARLEQIRGLGHLAHEERPESFAALITDRARDWDVL